MKASTAYREHLYRLLEATPKDAFILLPDKPFGSKNRHALLSYARGQVNRVRATHSDRRYAVLWSAGIHNVTILRQK